MKKIFKVIALTTALIISNSALAAGPYDGIWQVTYNNQSLGMFTVHENNGTVVAIQLDNRFGWGAAIGPRLGTTATVSAVNGYSPVTGNWTITFTSIATATLIQNSCTPSFVGAYCSMANNVTASAYKIF